MISLTFSSHFFSHFQKQKKQQMATKNVMMMQKQEFLKLLHEEVDRQSQSGRQCSAGEESPGGDGEDLVDDEDDGEDHYAVDAKSGQQAPRLALA